MELKEFVAKTLKEIIEGIKEAQEYASENKAYINPVNFGTAKPEHVLKLGDEEIGIVQPVSFDICINESNDKSGGISVSGFSIGGAKGMLSHKKFMENRVKFAIAVTFPTMEHPQSPPFIHGTATFPK